MTAAPVSRRASCRCGQLRLWASEEPLRVTLCHCLSCQQRTGSVFSANARFRSQAVRTEGDSSTFVHGGDRGERITNHFCPQCGSTVHYAWDDLHVSVPVGAFADPGFPPPARSIYEHRKHPWVLLPPGLEHG